MLPILLSVFVPLIGVIVFVIVGVTSSSSTSSTRSKRKSVTSDKPKKWDGKSTLWCKSKDKRTVTGVKAKVKKGAVIQASSGCRLKVVDATLRGPVGIDADGDVRIDLVNTKIVAEDYGVRIGSDAYIKLTNSRIRAKIGVFSDSGTTVEMRDSKIDAKDTGIFGPGVKSRVLSRSEVVGGDYGIMGDDRIEVEIDGGSVESAMVGIHGGMSSQIGCRNGIVSGKKLALELGIQSKINKGNCKFDNR